MSKSVFDDKYGDVLTWDFDKCKTRYSGDDLVPFADFFLVKNARQKVRVFGSNSQSVMIAQYLASRLDPEAKHPVTKALLGVLRELDSRNDKLVEKSAKKERQLNKSNSIQ